MSEINQDGNFSFINLTPAAYKIEFLSALGAAVIDRIDIDDPGESIIFDLAGPPGVA